MRYWMRSGSWIRGKGEGRASKKTDSCIDVFLTWITESIFCVRVGGTLYDRVRFAEWNGKEAYLDHGIVAVLLVHIGEVNDARAELEEGAVEEPIDKENVTHSVDEVEQLTREVGDDEARVGVERLGQILGYSSWSGFAFFVVVDHVKSAVALGHVAQFAVLPALPYPVRQVEEHTLKEEHERHPLIVAVHPLLSCQSFIIKIQSW